MQIKVRRDLIDTNDIDYVLFNGVSYILVTKTLHKGLDRYTPTLSKKLVSNLKKNGLLYTNDGLRILALKHYPDANNYTYYKFSV